MSFSENSSPERVQPYLNFDALSRATTLDADTNPQEIEIKTTKRNGKDILDISVKGKLATETKAKVFRNVFAKARQEVRDNPDKYKKITLGGKDMFVFQISGMDKMFPATKDANKFALLWSGNISPDDPRIKKRNTNTTRSATAETPAAPAAPATIELLKVTATDMSNIATNIISKPIEPLWSHAIKKTDTGYEVTIKKGNEEVKRTSMGFGTSSRSDGKGNIFTATVDSNKNITVKWEYKEPTAAVPTTTPKIPIDPRSQTPQQTQSSIPIDLTKIPETHQSTVPTPGQPAVSSLRSEPVTSSETQNTNEITNITLLSKVKNTITLSYKEGSTGQNITITDAIDTYTDKDRTNKTLSIADISTDLDGKSYMTVKSGDDLYMKLVKPKDATSYQIKEYKNAKGTYYIGNISGLSISVDQQTVANITYKILVNSNNVAIINKVDLYDNQKNHIGPSSTIANDGQSVNIGNQTFELKKNNDEYVIEQYDFSKLSSAFREAITIDGKSHSPSEIYNIIFDGDTISKKDIEYINAMPADKYVSIELPNIQQLGSQLNLPNQSSLVIGISSLNNLNIPNNFKGNLYLPNIKQLATPFILPAKAGKIVLPSLTSLDNLIILSGLSELSLGNIQNFQSFDMSDKSQYFTFLTTKIKDKLTLAGKNEVYLDQLISLDNLVIASNFDGGLSIKSIKTLTPSFIEQIKSSNINYLAAEGLETPVGLETFVGRDNFEIFVDKKRVEISGYRLNGKKVMDNPSGYEYVGGKIREKQNKE